MTKKQIEKLADDLNTVTCAVDVWRKFAVPRITKALSWDRRATKWLAGWLGWLGVTLITCFMASPLVWIAWNAAATKAFGLPSLTWHESFYLVVCFRLLIKPVVFASEEP